MSVRMVRRLARAALVSGLCLSFASCATQGSPVTANRDPASTVAAPEQTTASAASDDYPVEWTDEAARAFAAEVPKMVQKVARKGAEKKAREKGLHVIDMAFYTELKKEMNR